MKKWWVIPLLLCCAQVARGQCSNGPCYTANPPNVTRLTPAQYAAQGDGRTNAPATISTQAYDNSGNPLPGATPSHNLTVTPGTWVGYTLASANGVSAVVRYSQNGTSYPEPLNTTIPHFWQAGSQNVGVRYPLYFIVTDVNGNTMQDVASVLVVAGSGPSIVYQDKLPDNTILHFHASGGGGSMLNDFTICQGANQQHCINATHTPQTWLTVSNLTSGEVQSHAKHQSGNIAKANESVSFGDDMFLSGLPEDVFDYSEGDEVDCSVSGPVGVGPVQMDIRFERAITEEYISSILNSNGMHPEHIYCIIAATPPDFPGADEALPGTPSGQIVNVAFLYREWPKGTQEKGIPWNLVFPDIQEVGIGYYVKTTMEPDPVGCTMWDNGFRHLPLPTPLDPQPQ